MKLSIVTCLVIVACVLGLVQSNIHKNHHLKAKLLLAGQALGAVGAGSFASGLVTAGAAYKYHIKYHVGHKKHAGHHHTVIIHKDDPWQGAGHYPIASHVSNHHDVGIIGGELDHHDSDITIAHDEPTIW